MENRDTVQLIFLGLTAYQGGKLHDAIDYLTKALDIKKDEWEARLYLGMAYYRTGQRKQAKFQFQSVLDWCQNQEIRKMAKVALDAVNLELSQQQRGTSSFHEM